MHLGACFVPTDEDTDIEGTLLGSTLPYQLDAEWLVLQP